MVRVISPSPTSAYDLKSFLGADVSRREAGYCKVTFSQSDSVILVVAIDLNSEVTGAIKVSRFSNRDAKSARAISKDINNTSKCSRLVNSVKVNKVCSVVAGVYARGNIVIIANCSVGQ